MRKQRNGLIGIFASLFMLIIILDAKTAISGMVTGIELCMKTIVPSLFPFIFLSGIINGSLLGQQISVLDPLCKLCNIPKGGESIMLLGFLSGYPVGAQTIAQAYREGSLSYNTARRMLGFCNNAGPSFIFGMLSVLFSKKYAVWMLWLIHILSSLLVGCILPQAKNAYCNGMQGKTKTIHSALHSAIKSISYICGWVVLFRVVISFCDKWFMWLLPVELQALISGVLELSNGCIMLSKIPSEGVRFVFASGLIAFGGLCVGMQTVSATKSLGFGYYFPGKVLQTLFSVQFSAILVHLLFDDFTLNPAMFGILLLSAAIVLLSIGMKRKKLWHFQEKCSTIWKMKQRKGQENAVS